LNTKAVRIVVFSDLDGTLLDENYSFELAYPVISRLKALKVPIVLCSSKTRIEIEYFRTKMGIDDPFISENGAAIFIPSGYFKAENFWDKQTSQYDIVELGIAYSSIRKKFERIRKTCNIELIGFGDMTIEEIAKDTGLTVELAELAKHREYTEPFRHNKSNEAELFSAICSEGLHFTIGGKYLHLIGDHNKGKAVLFLKELFSKKFKQIRTVGVGNQFNDLEMLEAVDIQFYITKPEEIGKEWEKIICITLIAGGFCHK
jgi:mannosyl-3-phosphoglycerate phosphatase